MKRLTLITFAVFMVEAIIHYNIGAKSATKTANVDAPITAPHKLGIPPYKDLINMGIWVLVFSLITATLIKNK
jgi:hypothetical protein